PWTAVSSLSFPLAEGKSRQPFYCRVSHAQGTRVIAVENPGSSGPARASVSLYPPSREEFQGPYRNSSLLCQIHHGRRQPPPSPIRWLKNGLPVQDGVGRQTAILADGTALTEVRLTVTEAEWDEGTVYSCQAGEELRNTSKALECG
ncbi:IGHM protein, partial [Alcedo cyanopectus]|nr:IGHM protein [Ceyx cyanopectus]